MIGSILLSIKPEFAERIYSRKKTYELRKSKPNLEVPRCFLFETNGSQRITGLILIDSIISDSLKNLWEKVGVNATTEERFFTYFKGWKIGNALRIKRILRLKSPVDISAIRKDWPHFSVPQNYSYLHPASNLNVLLFNEVVATVTSSNSELLKFSPISSTGISIFRKLAFKELKKHYEEINDDFVRSITTKCGTGFTTMFRQLYEVRDHSDLIGFTTITYKLGNCIKTGPTIFLPSQRRGGFGKRLRLTFDRIASAYGVRKIYCTCPAKNLPAANYLFKSGHLLESVLRSQYKKGSDELVFGKPMFQYDNDVRAQLPNRAQLGIDRITAYSDKVDHIHSFVKSQISSVLFDVDDAWTSQLLNSWKDDPVASSNKHRKIFLGLSKSKIAAALISTPKRGKSVKLILLDRSIDRKGIIKVLFRAEQFYQRKGFRKLYSYVPANDCFVQWMFTDAGYLVDGSLREPFRKSNDFLVMTKFIH